MNNEKLLKNAKARYTIVLRKLKQLEKDPEVLEFTKSNANGLVQHPKAKTYFDLLKQFNTLSRTIQGLNRDLGNETETQNSSLREFMK